MTKPLDVVAIVGSLRSESLTRRVALGLADLMRDAMSIELLDVGQSFEAWIKRQIAVTSKP